MTGERPGKRHGRGFSLLLALTLVAALSLSAALLFGQVGDFAMVGAAGIRRQRLLLDAEAGLVYGIATATSLLYPGGRGPTLTGIRSLQQLSKSDSLCPDTDCSAWRLLQAAQPVGSEDATARVALACGPSDCSADVYSLVNVYVRSLGSLPSGDSRLLEATLALPQ